MHRDDIQILIEQGVPGASVTVSGDDGAHFEATVICREFAGKRTLERHRMVYNALGSRMGNEIHALTLRTYTPTEWVQEKSAD